MAVSSLLPTTHPLSLSLSTLPPYSISTKIDNNNNNIRRVSFSPIAYPKLSHSNSTALLPVKSSKYNAQILFEEDEPVKSSRYNVQILPEEDETDDDLIYRFRKEVIYAGVFRECRRRRFFENPIDKAKRKRREAAQRNRKRKHYFRTRVPDKSDTPNKEKDDDGEEEDYWDLSDVDLPYT